MPRTKALTLADVTAQLELKPLTARRVIASVLMDDKPRGIAAQLLVRIAELFDVSEGAARVAMSRMAAAGEVRTEDGRYWLAGELSQSKERIVVNRWPQVGPWDGTWVMRVVGVDGRTHQDRQELRKSMVALRHAELAAGIWIRPDNIVSRLSPHDELVAATQCQRFVVTPDEPAKALAGRLWDAKAWNDRAALLLRITAQLGEQLAAGDVSALAPGLVLSATVVSHGFSDPLLPEELRPKGWVGDELPGSLTEHNIAWRKVLRTWARR